MNTIVFQSTKPGIKECWLELCLQSVRNWAISHSHGYHYIEDDLFDVLPFSLRQNDQTINIYAKTDIARVLYAKKLIDQGWYDQAIWIDADFYIFDQEKFLINSQAELLLCREVWTWTDFNGSFSVRLKVNNCVLGVNKRSKFLDAYPEQAYSMILENQDNLSSLTIGTDFFTSQERSGYLGAELLDNVLLVNPFVMREFYKFRRSPCIQLQKALLSKNISAVHFANSFTREIPDRIHVDTADFAALAEFLIHNPKALIL